MELESFAATLAPHVDRLFVAGHGAARPYAAVIREEFGLAGFGVMIDLRALLLAPHGMTFDQAYALERYHDPDEIRANLAQHVEEGILTDDGERWRPTGRGEALLRRLMGALERATDSLWSGRSRVEELASIAATVVDEAHRTLDGATYPGFSANVGGFLPANAPPPFALWSHLASLRYLRADAHALAWTDAEITLPEIQILSFLRHSQAPSDVEGFGSIFGASGKRLLDALDSLQRRGFVATMEGGWTITPSGRAAREAIERATNAQNGVAYGTLSKAHRNAFLTGLAELPSERAMSEMQEYDDSVG